MRYLRVQLASFHGSHHVSCGNVESNTYHTSLLPQPTTATFIVAILRSPARALALKPQMGFCYSARRDVFHYRLGLSSLGSRGRDGRPRRSWSP